MSRTVQPQGEKGLGERYVCGRRRDRRYDGCCRQARCQRRWRKLRAAHQATLPAVTIGLISDAGGSAGVATGSLVEQGAKAAVAYLNEYQDGLEGHKKLMTVWSCCLPSSRELHLASAKGDRPRGGTT